ncbi:hypothetical protein ACFE04_023380 [Oxalis oulophora]
MSLFSRLRHLRHQTTQLRHFSSSILSPDASLTTLNSRQKSRAALTSLKFEKNPDRIVEICRAAALTPESNIDRIAFSIAIDKLSKDKHFTTIHEFLEELRTTRNDLKTERFVSHSIILYGQANMMDQAVATFKELHEGKEIVASIKSLNALLYACILAKDYKRLKSIFVQYPGMYDLTPDIDTYNNVIKAFSESGESDSCYSILSEMERKEVVPNGTTFSSMIAGFYLEEKFDDVFKVLGLMKDKYEINPGLRIYNVRVQGLCKLKKTNEAKALFDEMVSSKIKPDSVTYENLILGFCKEGNLDEAKSLFKKMTDSQLKPTSSCYFTMVHFLCQGGDFEAALSVFKQSMGKGWAPNFRTTKFLVEGLAKNSKVEEAKKVIVEIKEKFKNGAHMWTEVEASLP